MEANAAKTEAGSHFPIIEPSPGLLPKRPCIGALDVSTTRGIAALVLLFPRKNCGFDVRCHFWLPEASLTPEQEQWVAQGYLTLTPGNVTSYKAIGKAVRAALSNYDVRGIGYDRYNAMQLVVDLTEEGAPMKPVGQGFLGMSEPIRRLQKLARKGRIRHTNPMLTEMMGSVVLKQDAVGNVKIDVLTNRQLLAGPLALVAAIGLSLTEVEAPLNEPVLTPELPS